VPSLIPNIGPISIAFIAALFLIQRFGTTKVSAIFSPGMLHHHVYRRRPVINRYLLVTFVWLIVLFITGVYNVVAFPGIWRAYDPSRAVLCKLDANLIFSMLTALL
jgi:KUP system potassium uptake protein